MEDRGEYDVICGWPLRASSEGPVEHQKLWLSLNQTALTQRPYGPHSGAVKLSLNQTASTAGFSESGGSLFFPVNRVEHQKLNQTTPYGAVWLTFWCSTRPSADTGTN